MKTRQHCPHCDNQGLIRVEYRSGEPYDIAICDCPAGVFWRDGGEDLVRAEMQLEASHQVALLELFDGEAVPTPAATESFVAAGKTAKRAKL